jgi:predicted DNA-binding transcriptional regulator AlpA
MPPKHTKTIRKAIALPEDDEALIREDVVLGVYPVGATTLWNEIRAGTFPAPIKIGKRINAWIVGRVRRKLIAAADDAA